MSKQRAKGTPYENYVRDMYLLPVFPNAKRAPQLGIHDAGDFINTRHFLFEAKKWDKWDIPFWIRKTAPKAEKRGRPWVIIFARDKRKGHPSLRDDFAVLPARYLFRLLAAVYGAESDEDGLYDPFEGLNDER